MTPPSRLVLLGHPVSHSLSPRIQNAALVAAGIPIRYSALDILPGDLGQALELLRRDGAAGNVTVPHKEAAFERCDRVTPVARAAGAVNTFWFEGDVLVGTNTDVGGFDCAVRQLLTRHARPLPERVAVVGAGGSAAAVVVAASAWPGVVVTIWARRAAAAERLASRFDCARAETNLSTAIMGADVVVNATPIGLHDDELPIPLHLLGSAAPNSAVVDLVYRPGETEWVRAARAAGFVASDGLPMLIEQGALAFRCWIGIEADRTVMWEAARGA